MAVAGLRLLGQDSGRLCLTMALTPYTPGRTEFAAGPALREAAEAEARADRPRGRLGLLEIRTSDGVPAAGADVAALIRRTLADSLAADSLAGNSAPGAMASSARPRRISAGWPADRGMPRVSGHLAAVATSSLPLDNEGLTPMQATRALRYALSAFARGGTAAVEQAGFDGGLAGFVTTACARGAWLRQAIADRRFTLTFQPIVALGSGTIHHYEALLRPEPDPASPVRGPQDFVTFAETIGLSEELDWAVLGTACGAARTARGARIAANLSGLSLQSPAFRDRLLALLDAEPALTSWLLLEITETAEIDDEAEAVRTVAALRARGLPLCIDDFGAGAAAFRYLRILRVDYVKIDGIYVTNASTGRRTAPSSPPWWNWRGVGAKVVAEHIETEAEAALMRELGVEYGQGWLFGRPGPLPGRG